MTVAASLPAAGQAAGACEPDTSVRAGLTGLAKVNGSLTKSTQDGATLGGLVVTTYNVNPAACGPRRQRTLLEIRPSYEEKKKGGQPAIITRNHSATLQHLVFLGTNRSYVAANGRWLHNNALGVDLQQTYSLALGRVIDRGPFSLEVNAGPGFVGQNFMGTQRSVGFWGAALGETGEISFDGVAAGLTLHQTVRMVLPINRDDPWIGFGLLGLRIPLSSRFDIELSATDEYLSNPPAGSERSYLSSTVGLSFTF